MYVVLGTSERCTVAVDAKIPGMNTPLTDAEFDLLNDCLTNEEAPSDAMNTTMIDGFLAAAVASDPNQG